MSTQTRHGLTLTGLFLLLMSARAFADASLTVAVDLQAETHRVWTDSLQQYKPGGIVRLGGDTQPDCASAAMRLTRSAISEAEVGPAAIASLKASSNVADATLSVLGFGLASDAVSLVSAYVTASSTEEFIGNLESWAAGKVASGGAERLPRGFGQDSVLTTTASKSAEALFDALTQQFAGLTLDRTYAHPQCGTIQLRYRVLTGPGIEQAAPPLLRVTSQGGCAKAWPQTGSVSLGAFRVIAELPLRPSSPAGDDGRLVLQAGPPVAYAVTAACNNQVDDRGFRIVDLEAPTDVRSGGARGDIRVVFAGAVVFPVKMIYRPTAANRCPWKAGCASPERVFSKADATDDTALVFPSAIWCSGLTGAPHRFDYEVLLVDATGVETPPRSAPFTCLPED